MIASVLRKNVLKKTAFEIAVRWRLPPPSHAPQFGGTRRHASARTHYERGGQRRRYRRRATQQRPFGRTCHLVAATGHGHRRRRVPLRLGGAASLLLRLRAGGRAGSGCAEWRALGCAAPVLSQDRCCAEQAPLCPHRARRHTRGQHSTVQQEHTQLSWRRRVRRWMATERSVRMVLQKLAVVRWDRLVEGERLARLRVDDECPGAGAP